jgi:hypothetical protein
MFKRSNIIVALCTACALIAFAFYQRYEGPVAVSETEFFVAAAVICLAPVVYAFLRGKRAC